MSELIDRIIDEGAIKKQLDDLDKQLKSSSENLAACAVNAKAFSDAFGSSKGINDITTMLKQYNETILSTQKAQTEAEKTEKLRADTALKLAKAQEVNAKAELERASAILATQKAQESAAKADQVKIDLLTKSIANTEKAAKAEMELMNAKQTMINILAKEGISVDKMNMSKSQANAINRLVLAANNAEVGSREQLSAQFDLNYKAYSKLSAAQQNTAGGKAMQASILEQSNALKSTEGSLGNFTRDVGHYSSATKMMGINIGQILKELPNAGISGRTFIMSLSNNLIPLAESIKSVSAEQKLLTAAFKAGETDVKPASMMKLLGQSIFGLTGIMSVGVALFVAFGPEILKWASNLFAGDKVVRSLTSRLYDLNSAQQMIHKTMKDGGGVYADAVKSVEEMNVQLSAAKGNHEEEILALDKYNKGLGENFGKATSVGQALDIIASKKDAYIDAMMKMAYANAFLGQSQKDMVAYVDAQTKSQQELLRNAGKDAKGLWEEYEAIGKAIEEAKVNSKKGMTDNVNVGGIFGTAYSMQGAIEKRKNLANEMKTIELNERKRQLDDIAKHQGTMSAKYKEYYNLYLKELEENGIKSGKLDASQHKIYKAAKIKQFEWDIAMEESEAKTIQNMQENEIAAFDVTIDKKKKKVTDYIADLKTQQSDINAVVHQTKDPKVKAQAQEDFNKISIAITEAEQKKTDLFVQYELERQKGLFDIKSKWFVKYLNEEKSFQESQVKSTQDYGDKSLAYQQHITSTLFEIQAHADEKIARSRYLNGEITITALNTTLANIKAQRAALEDSQKESKNSDFKSRVSNIETKKTNDALEEKNREYIEGKLSASQYEKDIAEIKERGADAQLSNQIWLSEEEIENLKKQGKDTTKLEQELSDKKQQRDAKIADKKLQSEKALQKKLIELIKTSASAIKEIGDNQFQEQLDKIDALKTANTEAAAAETDAIDKKFKSGVLSQEEADARKASIDDQAKAREDQLNEEAKQTKIKQAKFDKEMSVFNILLNTATAVVEALPNVPLSIIIGAMGALELGAVLSKPIPAYALGTNDHIGGNAILGDGGKHEMAVTPSGSIIKTPKVPTVMSLPIHTKVFPDYDKAIQEMAFDASIRSMYATTPSIEINAYNDALMRKQMGSLVKQTERQINQLGKLNNLDRNMENMVSTNLKIVDAIKSNKKSGWND